jgi:hypothetical protein
MIKLEAKKAITNQAGSFSLYAAINRWIPKRKKNKPSNTRITCLTHHRMSDMETGLNLKNH